MVDVYNITLTRLYFTNFEQNSTSHIILKFKTFVLVHSQVINVNSMGIYVTTHVWMWRRPFSSWYYGFGYHKKMGTGLIFKVFACAASQLHSFRSNRTRQISCELTKKLTMPCRNVRSFTKCWLSKLRASEILVALENRSHNNDTFTVDEVPWHSERLPPIEAIVQLGRLK